MICTEKKVRLFEHGGTYEWDTTHGDCPAYLAHLLDPSLIHRIVLDPLTPHSIYISGAEYPDDPARWHSTVIKACEAIALEFGNTDIEIVEIGEVNPIHPSARTETPDD